MEMTTTRPARRMAAQKPTRKSTSRVKSTIVMDVAIDFRLSSIAASMRMDRSALAAKLIDDGLRRYALDSVLRQFSDRQDAAGGVSLESGTAA
jgi:hypothetical protein